MKGRRDEIRDRAAGTHSWAGKGRRTTSPRVGEEEMR